MARGKKSSTLGRNEFLFSGRKHQVAIPETNLCVLENDHRDQKGIKIQACWNSFRIFHSYNAIIDPTIDCLALVKKSLAIKAAKYQVTDIIPLKGWKDGVVVFDGLKVEDNEQDDIPMLIADIPCDMVLGRKWLEKSCAQLKNGHLVWLDDSSEYQGLTNQFPAKEDDDDKCLHFNLDEIRQEAWMGDDLIGQLRELDEDPDPKDIAPAMTSTPEALEEILVYELSDELNDEDGDRSRISVRLPTNDFRNSRLSDDGLLVVTPEAPVNASKDRITVGEDMTAVGPVVVRLPERRDLELSLPPSPLLPDVEKAKRDTKGIDKKWSCPYLLSVDPVEETCLAETAWNEELNDCRNESHGSRISVASGIDCEHRDSNVCNDISESKQDGLKDSTREESQITELESPCIGLADLPGDVPGDKTDDSFDHRRQFNIQIGMINDYHSTDLFLFVECVYDPEVCLPFGSTPGKDFRVHLMDRISCQLVNPVCQACLRRMKIPSFNDVLTDTGWRQLCCDWTWKDLSGTARGIVDYEVLKERGVGSTIAFEKDLEKHSLDEVREASTPHPDLKIYETSFRGGHSGQTLEAMMFNPVANWILDGLDDASDGQRDKINIEIETALWISACDTLSNLASLFFFWFDTGWYILPLVECFEILAKNMLNTATTGRTPVRVRALETEPQLGRAWGRRLV
ncbi:hypothetical protein V8E54_012943 [Elaphomyces granulatus]